MFFTIIVYQIDKEFRCKSMFNINIPAPGTRRLKDLLFLCPFPSNF
jgi:hypothetical protein